MSVDVKKKRNRNKKKIIFDEESISKDEATKILLEDEEKRNANTNNNTKSSKKREKKAKQTQDIQTPNDNEAPPIKKSKKRNANKPIEQSTPETVVEELDPTKPEIKRTESIRERKRKRHKKLIEDKRIKVDETMQKECLNYLSKWKHSKDDWKFVKLKQIWIQKNVFEEDKIPKDFWNTALEYFNSSKGKSRDVLLQTSLKIIENVDSSQVERTDEQKLKYNRAREIVQFLQE